MLYMVVERFKGQDPHPVYQRLRRRGRLAPAGLDYVASWVDTAQGVCFQLMETADPGLLKEWAARWEDIVDFEFYPVRPSAEAAEEIAHQFKEGLRDDGRRP